MYTIQVREVEEERLCEYSQNVWVKLMVSSLISVPRRLLPPHSITGGHRENKRGDMGQKVEQGTDQDGCEMGRRQRRSCAHPTAMWHWNVSGESGAGSVMSGAWRSWAPSGVRSQLLLQDFWGQVLSCRSEHGCVQLWDNPWPQTLWTQSWEPIRALHAAVCLRWLWVGLCHSSTTKQCVELMLVGP